jgi:hypothetical protein
MKHSSSASGGRKSSLFLSATLMSFPCLKPEFREFTGIAGIPAMKHFEPFGETVSWRNPSRSRHAH